MRIWNAITRVWQRLWRREENHDPPPVRKNYTKATNREEEGAHFYLRDILDRIRQTHRMLKRLKKVDREAYHFHGRIGARILPHKSLTAYKVLPARLPSVGMTYTYGGDDPESNWIPAAFTYFERVKSPGGVEPFNGPVYRMSVVHADGDKMITSSFHVGIDGQKARPLKCQRFTPRRIKMRVSSGNTKGTGRPRVRTAGSTTEMKYTGWGIDPHLEDFWRDHKEHGKETGTLGEFVTGLVSIAFNSWAIRASDELQVRVQRGKATALLSVSTKRTPYFFRDRETTVAADGKRKRIFHIVREHEREMEDGRIIPVKEHYRGERRFQWGGASVTITVPGKHHKSLTELNLEGIVDPEDQSGTISAKQAGEMIAEHMA